MNPEYHGITRVSENTRPAITDSAPLPTIMIFMTLLGKSLIMLWSPQPQTASTGEDMSLSFQSNIPANMPPLVLSTTQLYPGTSLLAGCDLYVIFHHRPYTNRLALPIE